MTPQPASSPPPTLERPQPILLDGATSTELQRRGCSVAGPWWSTSALRTQESRALVRQVHKDFLLAGAEVVTANTFRTNRYALAAAGLSGAGAGDMVRAALGEATAARHETGGGQVNGRAIVVAASIAPVRDCYSPALVPTNEILQAEHRWHIERLVEHGAELLLVETMNSTREAIIAASEGKRLDRPVWVSFVCDSGGRLLSGEPVGAAALAVADAGADAVLVNCTALGPTALALAAIRDAGVSLPLGCYPNIEDRDGIPEGQHVDRYVPVDHGPGEFAAALAALVQEFGLAAIGGCCGTSPEHLAAVRNACGTSSPTVIG